MVADALAGLGTPSARVEAARFRLIGALSVGDHERIGVLLDRVEREMLASGFYDDFYSMARASLANALEPLWRQRPVSSRPMGVRGRDRLSRAFLG